MCVCVCVSPLLESIIFYRPPNTAMTSLVSVKTFSLSPHNYAGLSGQCPGTLQPYLKSLTHRGHELGGYYLNVA